MYQGGTWPSARHVLTCAPVPAAKGMNVWLQGAAGRLLSQAPCLLQEMDTTWRMVPYARDGKGVGSVCGTGRMESGMEAQRLLLEESE